MIPCVYIFMKSKSKAAYIKALRNLLIVFPTLNPKIVHTDFEIAVIRAFREVFPNVIAKGCFFHFTQALWRNIQSKGLSSLYSKSTSYVSFWLNLFKGLAFLPPTWVEYELDQSLLR
jgi:hypothetical protein